MDPTIHGQWEQLTPEERAEFERWQAARGTDTGPSWLARLWGRAKAPLIDAVKRSGVPLSTLIVGSLFFFYVLGEAVQANIFIQVEHLLGVMVMVAAVVVFNIVMCVFLLDNWLSFREFGKAIAKWERGEAAEHDRWYVIAMAIRSGLVFLGICILEGLALLYLDFGGTV